MALGHSPSIVTNGLVFYYDQNNSQKSWIGWPVTNQYTLPTGDNNGFGVQNSTFYRVRSGTYGSQLLYMDLSTKKYYNLKHSMFNNWGKAQKEVRLNPYPVASQKLYATYRGTMLMDNVELGLFTDYEDALNAALAVSLEYWSILEDTPVFALSNAA